MKIFKSPWLYTGIVAFLLWFTPFSRDYGTYIAGYSQKMGVQTGKQLAFIYLIMCIIPVVVAYYMFRYAFKNIR